MKSVDTQNEKAQPGIIAILRAGFETVANHLVLVLFPIALDLIIWLGPHYRLKALIQSIAQEAVLALDQGLPETAQAAQFSKEFWEFMAENLNLATFLRTYPVGIPSLMSGRSPVAVPTGVPVSLEINSSGTAILLGLAFTLIGLIIGSLYYNVTAQASLSGKVNWMSALKNWPGSSFQVIVLAIFWVLLLLLVSIPSGCVMIFLMVGNLPLGQVFLFIYFGFLLWFLLPLFLSAHGIFIYKLKVKASIQRSIQITRWSLPGTGLFFLLVVLITQGLDIVWNWPGEDSWITIIGLAGHALVTSALLAASFIYYRQTDLAIQKRLGLIV